MIVSLVVHPEKGVPQIANYLLLFLIWLLAVVGLPGALGNLHVGENSREG